MRLFWIFTTLSLLSAFVDGADKLELVDFGLSCSRDDAPPDACKEYNPKIVDELEDIVEDTLNKTGFEDWTLTTYTSSATPLLRSRELHKLEDCINGCDGRAFCMYVCLLRRRRLANEIPDKRKVQQTDEEKQAAEAAEAAKKAAEEAKAAEKAAEEAKKALNEAQNKAEEAQNKAEELQKKAEELQKKAEEAKTKAEEAKKKEDKENGDKDKGIDEGDVKKGCKLMEERAQLVIKRWNLEMKALMAKTKLENGGFSPNDDPDYICQKALDKLKCVETCEYIKVED